MPLSQEAILDALARVEEPDLKQDLVSAGLVRSVTVTRSADGARDRVELEIGMHPDVERPLKGPIRRSVEDAVRALDPAVEVAVLLLDAKEVARAEGRGVLNYIAVASGKGGVGKSTVAANLVVTLAQQGYRVGLMDADVYGPSVPTMFGVPADEKPRLTEDRKIIPLVRHGVKLLSMGFLTDPAQAVVWRGPMASSAIKQFLNDAAWGDLDYLVLDLPPGTGDVQLTLVQTVGVTGAVVVSTPQEVALADARKGVAMFQKVSVPVLGIVENMAYFSPPDLPDRRYYLFGQGGARRLAETLGVPLLAEVPIEEAVRETGDQGTPVALKEPESAAAQAFAELARGVVRATAARNREQPATERVEILHR